MNCIKNDEKMNLEMSPAQVFLSAKNKYSERFRLYKKK